ncbi:hypothetical protein [uncultured Corynebacterium sp.]|uniref:hypothetical protein n=1 Tax=uncultured Corynebacterium sp. TaxID=159447 RepID=UPI0025F60686|nr:hypothetical protein [uncultured Corynebacterium sp.]
MSGNGIEEWAQGFFEQQAQLIADVLPFEPSVDAVLNEQTDKITAEIIVDLSYTGQLVTAENEACCTSSNLYDVRVEYRTGFDRLERFPTVLYSTFQIRAAGKPAIRFEYERDKSNVPAAHIHVHGVGGLLSPGLMKNGKKGSPNGDWQNLHLPVGGHRFRPSLEDFLYFVIDECGFRGRAGWENTLLESRESWLDKQCSAATRDAPDVAAEALRDLGYEVTPPSPTDPPPGRNSGW